MPLDQEPEQVEGALEGGARVCGDEAEVRICEGALSRTEEERYPTVRGVRAGEPVSAAEKTVASSISLARERRRQITSEPPEAGGRAKSDPNVRIGMAEPFLPRRRASLFRVSLGMIWLSGKYTKLELCFKRIQPTIKVHSAVS